jgi:hypothetical protein
VIDFVLSLNYQNISFYLVKKIPEFQNEFETHLKDQHGEILQHVLFGEFTRFFVRNYYESQKNSGAENVLLRCGSFIEEMLASNELNLKGLVVVSFLENLFEPKEEYYQPIKQYLKPRTLELLREVEK